MRYVSSVSNLPASEIRVSSNLAMRCLLWPGVCTVPHRGMSCASVPSTLGSADLRKSVFALKRPTTLNVQYAGMQSAEVFALRHSRSEDCEAGSESAESLGAVDLRELGEGAPRGLTPGALWDTSYA